MKILISNDDGIRATGINFLKDELSIKNEVITIAPHAERSSCGHGITLGDPIRVTQVDENSYACTGTPADCILIGVGHILKDDRPDLVVSGINHGANLGQDRFYSGTMAAAREATFRGIPAIAVSLVTKNLKDVEHFDVAAKVVSLLVEKNIQEYIPPKSLLNINVPNLPFKEIAGFKMTTIGFQKYSEEVIERTDGRGKAYYWVGGTYRGFDEIPGTDCFEANNGYVALNLQSQTDQEVDVNSIEKLKELIKNL